MTIDTDGLMKLLEGAELRLPLRYDEATRNVYTAEEEYDGENYHSWLAECGSPSFGRLSVAAVNALRGLIEEVERLRKIVNELSDCQPLPKLYKYTGTEPLDVENMFDVGHRHTAGKTPQNYLKSWLSMLRPFAYATQDESWGEMEKLLSIVMRNYVQTLVRAQDARAALNQEPGQ